MKRLDFLVMGIPLSITGRPLTVKSIVGSIEFGLGKGEAERKGQRRK
jgi:hypothetical protein